MNSHLRYTLRSLGRSPLFVLAVVAALGLGIGLNVAIFTVVDCVLLRPLAYHDADRIVALQTHFVEENRSIPRIGGDDYTDLLKNVRGLSAAAYYHSFSDGIQLDGTPLYVSVASVSPGFGQVMGVQPLAGRVFPSTDAAGHETLVSASFARQHFGSPQAALGHAIHYYGALRPIVGVLPDGFSFPSDTSVWFEDKAAPDTPSRTAYNQQAVAKRRAGVSAQQLNAELATFSRQLQSAFPEDRHKTIEAVPLQDQIVGKVRPTLRLLMGSVAVILLIVCVNVTHLQLVRATRQLRSITIRTALGASRATLTARAMLEAALLAAAGCLAAILCAIPALRLLVRIAPPDVPRLADIHLNLDVLAFSFLLCIFVMGLTAALPVWRSWRTDPASVLRQDASRGTEARSATRLRNGFLIAEIALTFTLSIGAVLLTRQLIRQSRQDLGFAADNLVTLDTHAVDASLAEKSGTAAAAHASQLRLAHLQDTLESLSSFPGVESVAAILGAPMGFGGADVGYAVKGRQVFAPGVEHLPNADIHPITPGLLATLQVPLLHGRNLSAEDRLGTTPVLLINHALAQQVFPGQDPIGQQIMCGYDEASPWWTIVGVTGDIRSDSPAAAPTPTFYVPIAQHPREAADVQLVVRTQADPSAMVEPLRNRLKQTHPEIVVQASTMRKDIGDTQRAEDFRTLLFTSFAAVSVLLAAIGIYGVMAYSVAQRNYEFALRVALGANRMQLLGMVLRNALTVATLGIAIGVVLSLTLTRMLGSSLGKLPTFDTPAYALAVFAILLIDLLATLIPARRAASIDPIQALRTE